MHAYHEIAPESLELALEEGLKTSTRGEKGDKSDIKQADAYLDAHRPEKLQSLGISRSDAIYAYLASDAFVIDITDGTPIRIPDFIRESDQIVLELTVAPERCYVSDLDAFDVLKDAMQDEQSTESIEHLAAEYWATLTPLDIYEPGAIKRPELLIPYDLPPAKIAIAREA